MFSFLRAPAPPRRDSSRDNPIYYEDKASWQQFHAAPNKYFVTHYIPHKSSMFNPPPHLHLYQDEEFAVREGTGIWRMPTAVHAAQREQVKRVGEVIHLPKGLFHQFENPSDSEALVVDIALQPDTAPRGREERFFRNFFGYLEDCRVAKVGPSLFQLELFLITIDGPLAIPTPGPDWLKWYVSWLVCYVLGVVIGEWLLGYQRSYPEYYRNEFAQLK